MSFIRLFCRWGVFVLLFIWVNTTFAEDNLVLMVKEPFVNVHTGPSSLHPVFYVVERGETIIVVLQKTQWIKIKMQNNKTGWVNEKDIKRTVYRSGETVEFDEVDFDEYVNRRIEVGVQAGSLETSPSFSLTAAYLFNELFSTQLSYGKSIGSLSSIALLSVDALMTPFPEAAYSPYFLLGAGQATLTPHTTLINPKTTRSSIAKVAVGFRKYLGERFVVRFEWANYILFSADIDADSNEEVIEWKVGFSTFF